MSGYYNPLDALVKPQAVRTLWAVGREGTEQPVALFYHQDDAELFASTGYCYPYKGFESLVVMQVTVPEFTPIRKIT